MKDLALNKKARLDYEILEIFEAGLVLEGQEVKAIKAGKMSLKGSFVTIARGEPFLTGATISPYQPKNTAQDYDPSRPRKLLLKKREIQKIIGKFQEKGLTLIPLKVYNKVPRIKLSFAIARGKKKYDKREDIKKREFNRDKDRHLKGLY